MAIVHITTPTEFQEMNLDLAGEYVVDNNIDMSGFSWTPVGNVSTPFTGSLDGGNKTISNLEITGNTSYKGVFGVAKDVTISNLVFSNCSIDLNIDGADLIYVGLLAGLMTSTTATVSCTVSNCTVTGLDADFFNTTSGSDLQRVGGLIGECDYTDIDSCFVSGTFDYEHSGSSSSSPRIYDAGGMIGYSSSTIYVDDCYTDVLLTLTGSISGTGNRWTDVAGFIGSGDGIDSTYNNCYSIGDINFYKGDTDFDGGFGGDISNSSLTNCYYSGNITGEETTNSSCLGGFVSDFYYSTVENCYSTGNITFNYPGSGSLSWDSLGGFASNIYNSDLSSCYSTMDISTSIPYNGCDKVGGFAGYLSLNNNNTIENCYSTGSLDFENVWVDNIGGFIGTIYVYDGSNITGCYCTGDITISLIGTAGGIHVGSAAEIGGFVGYLQSDTSINKNYTLSNIAITSSAGYDPLDIEEIGGFAGYSYISENTGELYDFYSRGNITINSHEATIENIGGSIGELGTYRNGNIRNGYTSADITISVDIVGSISSVGGFVGQSYLTAGDLIQNVFSAGIVTVPDAATQVGGFCGYIKTIPTEALPSAFIDNCSWYTSSFDHAVGRYTKDVEVYDISTLEEIDIGTDEPDNNLFKNSMIHSVFVDGTNDWDWDDVWRICCFDYPDFVGSPCPVPTYDVEYTVSSGCPQCGTYLYTKRGEKIRSGADNAGLNKTNESDYFVRCGRCGFPCKMDRDTRRPEGDRAGWGIIATYTEVTT